MGRGSANRKRMASSASGGCTVLKGGSASRQDTAVVCAECGTATEENLVNGVRSLLAQLTKTLEAEEIS